MPPKGVHTLPNSHGKMERIVAMAARAGVGIAALAASIALYAALVATKPQPEDTSSARPPALVRTVVATPVEVARAWEGFGTARAMNAADVSAEVSARVIERPEQIEAGAHVEAGDLLVRLDPIDFEQRVESAAQLAAALEADLESLAIEEFRIGEQVVLAAKEAEIRDREYTRALNALESGGGNVAEVEQRLAALQRAQRELVALRQQADLIAPRRARLGAQLAGARADLALAQQDLDRTQIRAPITGVLQSIGPEVGELVGIGQAVARIVDTSRIEIPLRMPASSVPDIALGAPVSLRPDGPVASVWLGNVARIAPEADPSTRMVTLFVEVEQDHEAIGGGLMPGRFVVGTVRSSSVQPRVIVPRGAVREDRVALAIPRGSNHSVSFVAVEVAYFTDGSHPGIDRDENQWAVLASGVSPGALVIVSSADLVQGEPVRISAQTVVGAAGAEDRPGDE